MKKCELCNSTARMYCDSDQASLCWDCDAKVHNANFLVSKHSRTLLCHACQSLTPWTGSGPKLGPTVSVCDSCLSRRSTTNHSHDPDLEHDREDEDHDLDDEDEGEDHDEDDDHDEADDSDEDDGDNQVVPLSSTSQPPPMASNSSSSEESSSRLRGGVTGNNISSAAFSSRLRRHIEGPQREGKVATPTRLAEPHGNTMLKLSLDQRLSLTPTRV